MRLSLSGGKKGPGTQSRTDSRLLVSVRRKSHRVTALSAPPPALYRKHFHSDSSGSSVPFFFSRFRKSDWLVFLGGERLHGQWAADIHQRSQIRPRVRAGRE